MSVYVVQRLASKGVYVSFGFAYLQVCLYVYVCVSVYISVDVQPHESACVFVVVCVCVCVFLFLCLYAKGGEVGGIWVGVLCCHSSVFSIWNLQW